MASRVSVRQLRETEFRIGNPAGRRIETRLRKAAGCIQTNRKQWNLRGVDVLVDARNHVVPQLGDECCYETYPNTFHSLRCNAEVTSQCPLFARPVWQCLFDPERTGTAEHRGISGPRGRRNGVDEGWSVMTASSIATVLMFMVFTPIPTHRWS